MGANKLFLPEVDCQVTCSVVDRKGFLLILLSSILLGIWATVNTIALRNILLVFSAGLSIIYIREWFKMRDVSLIKNHLRRTEFFCWLPSILIMVMFIWVIVHYLLFSQSPQKQWDELTSTWLRALMASVIGFGCALALRRNGSLAWLLWLGLILSFLVLIHQYIPKALANRSLLAIDWFGNYIYWAKFSGVLAGITLFAGTLGLSIDRARRLFTNSGDATSQSSRLQKVSLGFAIALGLFLPIYSFVYIFSAKNGVGVAAILSIFLLVAGGISLVIQFFGKGQNQFSNINWLRWSLACLVVIISSTWLGYQHVKNNPGWESLIEDIQIGVQIDKYQNWQNPGKYGFPNRSDGSSVASNTYERTALIVVGLRLIMNNPIGNGVLRSLRAELQKKNIEYDTHLYTHSAWIDLGLSYGWPGLLILPTALILCLFACIKKYRGPYRGTVTCFSVSFLVLYLVGEYAFQHGIEILLFICALLAGMIFPAQKAIPYRYLV